MSVLTTPQAKGTLITVLGALVLAPDAALVKLVGVDVSTMVFWRGVGMGLVTFAVTLLLGGRRALGAFLATGATGALLVLCLAVSQTAWVAGVALTNPAHVLVLTASAPLFGALASWLILGERVRPATAAAMVAALVAVGVIASEGLGGGDANPVGDFMGIVVAASMGLGFTLVRKLKVSDPWMHFGTAAFLNALWAGLLFPLEPVAGERLALLLLVAFVVVPLAFMLISIGPRYITVPEVALIMLLEVVAGALFLWWLAAEPPTVEAVVGGAILVAALALHALWMMRHPPLAAEGIAPAAGG